MRSAAVILAAGAGHRLGGAAKAVLRRRDGLTFLAAVSRTARAAGVEHIVVVAGPPHGEVTQGEADHLDLATVINPQPHRGMASSVAIGFGYALRHFASVRTALLWPVDVPWVRVDTVHTILTRATAHDVVIPAFGDRGGHPTGFGRDLWQDLAECTSAPQGARSVVRALGSRYPERVTRIAVADPGVSIDVDLPADVQAGAQNDP